MKIRLMIVTVLGFATLYSGGTGGLLAQTKSAVPAPTTEKLSEPGETR